MPKAKNGLQGFIFVFANHKNITEKPMLKYSDSLSNETSFLALTSLTPSEFIDLEICFSEEWNNYILNYTQEGKLRERSYSVRKDTVLPQAGDKLFFMLYYLKNQPLQQAMAANFGMSQPQANIKLMLYKLILHRTLKRMGVLPARTAAQLQRMGLKVGDYYTDATERVVPRSVDIEEQKQYYSGKQKRHTVKNAIFTDGNCKILFLSATVTGKMHDKKLNEESQVSLPDKSTNYQDTGYLGYTPKGNGIEVIMPHKKPRGKELTDEQKQENTVISKVRVKVEHAMAGIKRLRILKDKIRPWANDFRDQVIAIGCALHNFRIRYRPWNYPKPDINLQS